MIYKKTIVTILKAIGYSIAGIVSFVLLILAIAYCLSRITVHEEGAAKREIVIYIKTNGVHADIVVPLKSDV